MTEGLTFSIDCIEYPCRSILKEKAHHFVYLLTMSGRQMWPYEAGSDNVTSVIWARYDRYLHC